MKEKIKLIRTHTLNRMQETLRSGNRLNAFFRRLNFYAVTITHHLIHLFTYSLSLTIYSQRRKKRRRKKNVDYSYVHLHANGALLFLFPHFCFRLSFFSLLHIHSFLRVYDLLPDLNVRDLNHRVELPSSTSMREEESMCMSE